MNENEMTELRLSGERIFSGRIIGVERDRVRLPDGGESVREVVRHPGAVCVVPLTDSGEVLLVRQYRYPEGRVFTEIPAGKLEVATPTQAQYKAIDGALYGTRILPSNIYYFSVFAGKADVYIQIDNHLFSFDEA